MSAATKTAKSRKGHEVVQPSGPLVICQGGDLDGQTFTASDWQARLTSARLMQQAGQRPSPVLGYAVDPSSTTTHRNGLIGMPATWIGLEHLAVKGGACR